MKASFVYVTFLAFVAIAGCRVQEKTEKTGLFADDTPEKGSNDARGAVESPDGSKAPVLTGTVAGGKPAATATSTPKGTEPPPEPTTPPDGDVTPTPKATATTSPTPSVDVSKYESAWEGKVLVHLKSNKVKTCVQFSTQKSKCKVYDYIDSQGGEQITFPGREGTCNLSMSTILFKTSVTCKNSDDMPCLRYTYDDKVITIYPEKLPDLSASQFEDTLSNTTVLEIRNSGDCEQIITANPYEF